MNKKLQLVFLFVPMLLLICACSPSDDDEDGVISPSASLSAKGVFPVSSEKIELTVFAYQPSTIEDMDTNMFTQEFEDLTNVHINWETVTEDGLQQRRNVLFASGDYPDALLGAEIPQQDQMIYGEQGVLIPLNDLIDTYSVELPRLFEEIDWLKALITSPDGNIYALPQINECYHCTLGQKLWINQTWLDALGLPMPATTEEFEATLRAFKNDDPNRNGIADEIPLSGANTGWNAKVPENLMNAFIYNDGSTETFRVQLLDGGVDFTPDNEEFKAGLAWLTSLYEQDLIDPSAFTQPAAQLKELAVSKVSILGAVAAGAPTVFSQMGSKRSSEYVAIPPLKGPDGVQYTYHNPFGISLGQFAITSANKNPIETIKWIDYLYSELGTRRALEGREGEEWVKPKAGTIAINGGPAEWKRNVSLQDIQNITWQNIPLGAVTSQYRLSELAGDPTKTEGFETRLFNETFNKYDGFQPDEVFPPLFIPVAYIDEMAKIKKPLLDFVRESMAKFITGVLDIDADWDEYISDLKALDSVRYEEILQIAYDESPFSK